MNSGPFISPLARGSRAAPVRWRHLTAAASAFFLLKGLLWLAAGTIAVGAVAR